MVQVPPIDQLQIATSYQSFVKEDVEIFLNEISTIAPTKYIPHIRKSVEPSPVMWIFLAFAGGIMAHFGELVADKVISNLKTLGDSVIKLMNKRGDNEAADIIFAIPIPNTVTIVEAAIESASSTNIQAAISKLPNVYKEASRLTSDNRQDYFEQIKYLFNPKTETWEINYLVISKSKEIVFGPRYYDADHPLHERYQIFQNKVSNTDLTTLGVSIGGTLRN